MNAPPSPEGPRGLNPHGQMHAGSTSFSVAPDPAEAISIPLTDSVTCRLGLIPLVGISSVTVDQSPDGAVTDSDLDLVARLLGPDAPLHELSTYALAVELHEAGGSGAAQTVLCAAAALDLIDVLNLPESGSDDRGAWTVWRTMSHSAGLALSQVPPSLPAHGATPLRLAVLALARRFRTRSDRLTSARLEKVIQDWPIPAEDQPIPGDDTMAELYEQHALAAELRALAPEPEVVRSLEVTPTKVSLFLGLEPLVDIGLVLPGAAVTLEPVASRTGGAWTVRVPLRTEVGIAFSALRAAWADALDKQSDPEFAVRLELAHAALLAETQLPFTYDDLRKELTLKVPAPPHLMDVVCVVFTRSGRVGRDAQFALVEQQRRDGGPWELRTTIPHADVPNAETIQLALRADRSPYLRVDKPTITRRVLKLRRSWHDGTFGPANEADYLALLSELGAGRDDLASALRRERSAFLDDPGGTTKPDVVVLIDALRASAAELARSLRAAVSAEDLHEVRRLVDELWRTRAYLVAAPR